MDLCRRLERTRAFLSACVFVPFMQSLLMVERIRLASNHSERRGVGDMVLSDVA